jgi:hypothetical protein
MFPRFGESDADQMLDAFLGQCLYEAGVWSSPRGGDGIARLRVVERTSSRVRLLGRIRLIESQLQEPFWLDLAEDIYGGGRIRWTLRFGLLSFGRGRPRDLRDAVHLMGAPEDGAWRVLLDGAAVIEDDQLRPVELAAPV